MKRLDITKKKFDQPLLWSILALIVIGTIMQYSSSTAVSLSKTNGETGTYYLIAHLKRLVVSIVALLIFMHLDYRKLKSISIILIVGAIALLGYTKIWYMMNGISTPGRWIFLGSFSLFKHQILLVFL